MTKFTDQYKDSRVQHASEYEHLGVFARIYLNGRALLISRQIAEQLRDELTEILDVKKEASE